MNDHHDPIRFGPLAACVRLQTVPAGQRGEGWGEGDLCFACLVGLASKLLGLSYPSQDHQHNLRVEAINKHHVSLPIDSFSVPANTTAFPDRIMLTAISKLDAGAAATEVIDQRHVTCERLAPCRFSASRRWR